MKNSFTKLSLQRFYLKSSILQSHFFSIVIFEGQSLAEAKNKFQFSDQVNSKIILKCKFCLPSRFWHWWLWNMHQTWLYHDICRLLGQAGEVKLTSPCRGAGDQSREIRAGKLPQTCNLAWRRAGDQGGQELGADLQGTGPQQWASQVLGTYRFIKHWK